MSQKYITPGERFPELRDHTLYYISAKTKEPTQFSTSTLVNRKYVVVGVPAAFSPPCSEQHLPSYFGNLKAFTDEGYELLVINVDNVFVNKAWAEKFKVFEQQDHIKFLCDQKGEFLKELGLITTDIGFLGGVSSRFAFVIDHGTVKYFGKEEAITDVDLSSADKILHEVFGKWVWK